MNSVHHDWPRRARRVGWAAGEVSLTAARRASPRRALRGSRAFAGRGVPLTVRSGGPDEVAKLYERSFVLVRPDGRVAWRGDDLPQDPAALVDTVRGGSHTP